MKQFLCILLQLLVCFGWLSSIALAQLEISGAITGSASLPQVGITCLGNLAVFIRCILRKRLHLEMGARDFLATNSSHLQSDNSSSFKFEENSDNDLEKNNENEQKKMVTCIRVSKRRPQKPSIARLATGSHIEGASVVMLSNSAGMTNSSIRQFMEYIYDAHHVQPILLKYDILKDTKAPDSHCKSKRHSCNCIVISKVEWINMPQVSKESPESRVLLPSLQCLQNKCHGCKPHLLHVEKVEDNLNVEFSSAVIYALDFAFTTPAQKEPICICIPVHRASDDKWTKLLVSFFNSKDPANNADMIAAAEVLQSYLDNRGKSAAEDCSLDEVGHRAEDCSLDEVGHRAELVIYETVPLIVIRFIEILVNVLLTVFFKVDGFSSSLAARRAVRGYVVDDNEKRLSLSSFLTSGLVVVKSDSVCQVLKFRGKRTFLLIVGFVNLLCAFAWVVVLIAFNGGVGKWYAVHSMEPSKPRVAVIIAAICIGICMDCFEFSKRTLKKIWKINKKENKITTMILGVIILELVFAVVAGALGLNKGIGRRVYGALQVLVWVKWGIGSYLLGPSFSQLGQLGKIVRDVDGRLYPCYSSSLWTEEGNMVYSSSFFLNAVMVGVMGDWAGIWSTWK